MSIWQRIADALSALANGESLGAVFDRLRNAPEHSVGFTIAVIALGAKMAKADGKVTRDEVSAFREVFHIPPEEETNAARIFNLARQDVAGFDTYAHKIAAMFERRHDMLTDLLEGLFYIAVADGSYHAAENDYLSEVARIFGVSKHDFSTLRAQFVADATPDPYAVLGITDEMPLKDIRQHWRKLVRDTHPDKLIARGVPEEAVKMAEKRLIKINAAWDEIESRHGAA